MEDFIIPKGSDFTFTIKVIEKDSFLAQDLTNMDTATIEVFKIEDFCKMFTTTMTVQDALNGILEGTMIAANTATLAVTRGGVEDNYYLKAGYQAHISITFTDATLPITVLLDRVYVSPIGVTCA